MSSPAPARGRPPSQSLQGTVVRLAAVATVAAVLLWSVLFVNLLDKAAAAPAPQPGGIPTSPSVAPSAQTPAPVTTRTS